ncbi:MAG: transketolase [Synergistaceae bacterium]|jgi:transketolase|nr:transketolase [Synergistaceae bacterium]
MDAARHKELERIALEVRKDVVRMMGVARTLGISKALSIVDILVYMYWEHMKVYPGERNRPDRDRLVLGRGSAAPALYACLSRLGFFDRQELWSFSRLGAMLQGYPDIRTPGVDAPGGGLGGGLGIALGLGMGLRMEGVGARVFCVMDEYEMSVGAAWESASTAASDRLGRVVLIVDTNGTDTATAIRLEACGWSVTDADGSDMSSIESSFGALDYTSSTPKAVMMKTSPGRDSSEPLSRFDMDNALSKLENGTVLADIES